MAQFTRLRDLYSFPGFTASAFVCGVFGDPYAVVLTLQRRPKKRFAVTAARLATPSTIRSFAKCATSIVEDAASTSNSPYVGSRADNARP